MFLGRRSLLFGAGFVLRKYMLAACAVANRARCAMLLCLDGSVHISRTQVRDNCPAGVGVWLQEQDRISVAAGNTATLVFLNGKTYDITGPAKASIEHDRLAGIKGSVRLLPPLPVLPTSLGLDDANSRFLAVAASVVRNGSVLAYPTSGEAVIAGEELNLLWRNGTSTPVDLSVKTSSGTTVHQAKRARSPIAIAPGTLPAGEQFLWTIDFLDERERPAQSNQSFRTLTTVEAEERTRFRMAVDCSASRVDCRLLMATVDEQLSLRRLAYRQYLQLTKQSGEAARIASSRLSALERSYPELQFFREDADIHSSGSGR